MDKLNHRRLSKFIKMPIPDRLRGVTLCARVFSMPPIDIKSAAMAVVHYSHLPHLIQPGRIMLPCLQHSDHL